MNPIPTRALALALAVSACLSVPGRADSDEAARLAHLDTSVPDVGGFTTLTVRSPLVGSRVRVALDDQLGPRFVGNFNRPVVALSHGLTLVGGGSIGADGSYTVDVPTPALGETMYLQAFVYSNGYVRASNLVKLEVGGSPAGFANGTAGLDPSASFQVTSDVDWIDLDKDGCQDIVSTAHGSLPMLQMGDCSGSFVDEAATRLPAVALPPAGCVEVGDVNGDSWPDLFFCGGVDASSPAPNVVLLNDRTGHFVELGSPEAVAILGASGSLPAGAGRAIEAKFGDVDGDGDVDLIVTSVQDTDHPAEVPQSVVLYENGGLDSAQFTLSESFEVIGGGAPHSARGGAALADFDADGDLDLFVVGAFTGTGAQNQFYVNLGGGTFANVTGSAMPAVADNSYEAQVADFDGDGDLDVFVANSISSTTAAVHLYENVTTTQDAPVFIDASAKIPSDLGPVTKVRLCADAGDLDGDGDQDIVIGIHELPGAGGVTDGETVMLRNQGGAQGGVEGEFVVDASFLPGLFVGADVSLGDADFDGDLDLYIGNSGNLFQFDFHDELWINQQ